jgi:dipeptidyl-peptidase-4
MLVVLFTCSAHVCNWGLAYPPSDDSATQPTQPDEPKTLTLQRLYHPKHKHDFDGELPSVHWVGTDSSKLVIRVNGIWKQFSPDVSNVNTHRNAGVGDHSRQPWAAFDRLCKHVQALENVDAKAATRAVARAVTNMKEESDTLLVKIGDAMAIVSADRPARMLTRDASSWKNAMLDPSSRRIAYTVDGDLYVADVTTHLTRRLTDDGLDTLLDGELDWTYQEEIFGRGKYRAFWFSPDGNWLAMMRIDTSGVQPYELSASSDERGKGPLTRYSKPGDEIPHASLHLWDLRRFDVDPIPAPQMLIESTGDSEKIITGVGWHEHDSSLVYSVSDRKQTYRMLYKVDPLSLRTGSATAQLLLREESPSWVEPPMSPAWLSDGGLLWHSELPSGQYRVYRISSDGSSMAPVTPSGLSVRDFKLSQDERVVWVVGDETGGVDQHLYRIALDQPTKKMTALTTQPGWHVTKISPDGRQFTDQYSDPSTPPTLLLRRAQADAGGSRNMDDVVIAKTELATKSPIRRPKMMTITTDDGVNLPAMLIEPDFEPDQAKKYPVVIEVYGGPGSPIVSSRYAGHRTLYRELLARRGIGTLVVENRSSSGASMSMMWSIRGRLGEVEFRDVCSAAAWLKSQNWVDADRLAIRGWSYGGFLTLYAMTHSDAFAAGIAGGSVTDWRQYDSFYTERYMGLLSENPSGYETTSLIDDAKNLSGQLLMIHGEVDDNVHPANTLRMAEALQKAGKSFQMMIYPGAGHSITDGKQNWHLVQMMDQFLMDALAD